MNGEQRMLVRHRLIRKLQQFLVLERIENHFVFHLHNNTNQPDVVLLLRQYQPWPRAMTEEIDAPLTQRQVRANPRPQGQRYRLGTKLSSCHWTRHPF